METEFAAAQTHLLELITEHRKLLEIISRKEHEQRVSALTLKQLQSLPNESTRVYRTLGKAFILGEMEQVQERLKNVSTSSAAEREKLISRKSELEQSIGNAEEKAKQL